MKDLWCPLILLLSSALISPASGTKQEEEGAAGGGGAEYHGGGTIVISSVGRAQADFGLYYSLPFPTLDHQDAHPQTELQLIAENDNGTMRYNGHFVPESEKKLLLQALNRGDSDSDPCSINGRGCKLLAYVSEEEGTPQVYFGALDVQTANGSGCSSMEGCHHDGFRLLGKLSDLLISSPDHVPFQDRPSVAGGRIVYVGMRRPPRLRRSWAAVFSKDLTSGVERCLTLPDDAADFSPALSPCGKWVIVASDQCHGFNGEMCILNSDLYMFSAEDGSQRRLLVKDGGWPCWAYDGSRFFFHRRVHDGWWSVFEAHIPSSEIDPVLEVKRLTGPGFHAFTPAAAASGPAAPGALEWIVVATRRPGSQYRQIEILILQTGQLIPLTHSHSNHYNPFVLLDAGTIGYHRCTNRPHRRRNLEYISSPFPNTSVLRIDGDFPSFSRDGSLIAFTPDVNSKDAGVDVMRVDGSRRRTIFPWKVSAKTFGTAWHEDGQGNAVVYTSIGQDIFMTDDASTYIVAIAFNASKLSLPEGEQEEGVLASEIKVLTRPGDKSNAFPSPSPDGKELVVSSSRSGYRNLYILDAQDGSVRERLTEGEWTDTMCDWSAANGWIAFSSNRESSRYGTKASYGCGNAYSYDVFLVHPRNKSNVVRVTNPGSALGSGLAVHPKFSPDGKSLALTADYAGLSAEPVASGPNQFQPYGEIYVCSLDWSRIEVGCVGLERLTFSPYETSLAAWGKVHMTPPNIKQEGQGSPCKFHDPFWLRNVSQEVRFCTPSNALARYPPEDYLVDVSLYENLRNISLYHKMLSYPFVNLNQYAHTDEL